MTRLPGGAAVTLADGRALEFDRRGADGALPPDRASVSRTAAGGAGPAGKCRLSGHRLPLPAAAASARRSYYVTNITDEWVPFTAVIEMTALVDRERFGGHTLVYLPRYLTQDSPVWEQSDEELAGQLRPGFAQDVSGAAGERCRGLAGGPRTRGAGGLHPELLTGLAPIHGHIARERVRRQ